MHNEDKTKDKSSAQQQPIASAQRATSGLSKQAFREMLAAAERVNRHHTAQKTPSRPS